MEEKDMQKELFEDLETERMRFPAPRGLLTRPMFVTIPLERIIFIGIGVLMALVIVHALGVERGKSLAKNEIKKSPLIVKAAARPKPVEREQQGAKVVTAATQTKQPPPVVQDLRPFTVVLESFAQRSLAEAEVNRLKAEGYHSFSLLQGSSVQVCIGRFASTEDAARLQKSLVARYRDCVVKKVQQGTLDSAGTLRPRVKGVEEEG